MSDIDPRDQLTYRWYDPRYADQKFPVGLEVTVFYRSHDREELSWILVELERAHRLLVDTMIQHSNEAEHEQTTS